MRLVRRLLPTVIVLLACGRLTATPTPNAPPVATLPPPTSAPPTTQPPTATPPPTATRPPPTATVVTLPHTTVDATTLTGKLLLGYQGWFTCPGDGTTISNNYYTWILDGFGEVSPESYGVEMWPDTSELTPAEQCPTQLTYPDGRPAYLYSAVNFPTVLRHFQWMSEYGLDGVFLQRFGGQLYTPEILEQRNRVTQNVQAAAAAYGRTWAMMYDVTGMEARRSTLVQTLEADWRYLVDELRITESPGYLHHNGRPVLAIWGLGFFDRAGTPAQALELVAFFQNNPDPRYRVTLVGGVPFGWRTLELPAAADPAWADYYCALDIISPWSVGAFTTEAEAAAYAETLRADLAHARACGAELLPVVYPGIAMHTRYGRPFNEVPRRGGRLYWQQVYTALDGGATMLYNAMFDEVNEATAMYKLAATSADAPTGLTLINLDTDGECLPNDWYLRLAGEATRRLRGELPLTPTIPLTPPAVPGCRPTPRLRLVFTTTSDWSTLTLAGRPVNDLHLAAVSPGAAAGFDPALQQLLLTQPLAQANAGQAVTLTAEAYLDAPGPEALVLTVGRGSLGASQVAVYAVTGTAETLVDTLEWAGLTGEVANERRFEVATDGFAPPP